MDFIDTIIKIGFGALLTGAWVFYHQRRQTRPVDPYWNRRMELLEAVAEQVGRVNHVFGKYAALVKDSHQFPDRVTAAQHNELNDVTNELVEAYGQMSSAEAKLALLGEKRLEKALKLYSARIAFFRNRFSDPRAQGGDPDLPTVRKEIGQMRDQFYDILSERFDSTLGKMRRP